MQDGNASRASVVTRAGYGNPSLSYGGAGLKRAPRHVRATSPQSHLGAMVLVAVTFALVGLLIATFQNALESPSPGDWSRNAWTSLPCPTDAATYPFAASRP